MSLIRTLLAAASLAALSSSAFAAQASPVHNIVLVHGAFADGSGWKSVAEILQKDGFHVSVVQDPLTSLADDVAATKNVLAQQDGPAVLVGHSYGGAVITEAGNDAKVASLVYVAAFAPDEGETVGQLIQGKPGKSTAIGPVPGGFLAIDPAKFPQDFAADVPAAEAKFMAISQVPMAAQSGGTKISAPAWKSKPTYAIVATEDHMINPDSERAMYKRANAEVTEVKASHAVYVSQPKAVAKVIEDAARAAK
jgi:pimeloyl-ACP methyl ester carboxylesterase